jgi:hypothetical protein
MTRLLRWRVRTTVPITSRPNTCAGFTVERIRAPRRGIDRGLYLVRAPDGRSRTAVLRGASMGERLLAHLVYLVADGFELGAEVGRFWPKRKMFPATPSLRDAHGDFYDAVRFACLAGHGHAAASSMEHTDE